jgi:hypothetical protein
MYLRTTKIILTKAKNLSHMRPREACLARASERSWSHAGHGD